MEEKTISIMDSRVLRNVFGASDEHLRTIRKLLGIQVTVDGSHIIIRSDNRDSVRRGSYLLEQLQYQAHREGGILSSDDIRRAISEVLHDSDISQVRPLEVYNGRQIRPKTAGQAQYVDMLRKKEVVFCVGPAGTGKTYLAVARAVESLRTEGIRRIVLVRPAVEAGESLGFLPGDLEEKINPYLRPLFDALADMVDHDILQRYMAENRIEVIPLAYMRGRTINRACIILDEAQNTTVAQMKMFLTRMGEGSRIVVCGDPTQIDLPPHKKSGLADALLRLKNIEGIGHIGLGGEDIVRHDLVQRIVRAYEQTEHGRISVFAGPEPHDDSDSQGQKRQYDFVKSNSGSDDLTDSVGNHSSGVGESIEVSASSDNAVIDKSKGNISEAEKITDTFGSGRDRSGLAPVNKAKDDTEFASSTSLSALQED